jgi:DNA primase
MNWAQDLVSFSASQLTSREREALCARGVTDDQIEMFQIGYLNKSLPEGLPEEFLKWSQNGEKLNDTFIFPLTTALGDIKGFQFRSVKRDHSKYMDYFLGHCEPCLFGLHQAIKPMWENRTVYLVEGVFDLFPIQRAVPFVISTLTSRASGQIVRFLRRVVTKVWLGYDMDDAGRKGCAEFKKRYGHSFEVYIMTYPKVGKKKVDPGELWELWGDTQMIPFIKSAMNKENPFC